MIGRQKTKAYLEKAPMTLRKQQTEQFGTQVSVDELLELLVAPRGKAPSRKAQEEWYVQLPSSEKWQKRRMSRTHWQLRLALDSDPQQQIALELVGDVILGVQLNSDDDLDLNLNIWRAYDKGVSRRHLMLRPTDQRVLIADLGSTNGTIVNGRSLSPQEAYPVQPGNIISLGRLHLRVLSLDRVMREDRQHGEPVKRVARAGTPTPAVPMPSELVLGKQAERTVA